MEIEILISLIIFSITMTYTPGPSNILLMGTAMKSGFKRTIPMLFGVVFGFLIVSISIAVGLGEVFKLYPYTLKITKVLGTIYLLYLSYKIFESRNKSIKSNEQNSPSFIKGAMIHPLSPKAWLMAISAFSQYVTIGGDILLQSTIIISSLVISGATANCLWMFSGAYLQKYLQNKKVIYWTFSLLSLFLLILIITMWL